MKRDFKMKEKPFFIFFDGLSFGGKEKFDKSCRHKP